METKGLAVVPMREFVKKNYPSRYDEWLGCLSAESQRIMNNPLPSAWYPLKPAIVEPTELICRLFYNGDKKGAWQVGRYSADYSLHGIYAIFVKIGTPGFIIKRGTKIMSQYYNQSELVVVSEEDKKVVVHITKFAEPDRLVEMRVAGWIERALEVSGQKNVKVDITRSLSTGDILTEYMVNWN